MIWDFLFYVCVGVSAICVILYCIWLYRPDLIIREYISSELRSDYIVLQNGECLDVSHYPKYSYVGNSMESMGFESGDTLFCDPEHEPKVYLHDVVIDDTESVYVVDTCHKDGTYTLKNDFDRRVRVNRSTIKGIVKYVINSEGFFVMDF